jgi:hypothetical protein
VISQQPRRTSISSARRPDPGLSRGNATRCAGQLLSGSTRASRSTPTVHRRLDGYRRPPATSRRRQPDARATGLPPRGESPREDTWRSVARHSCGFRGCVEALWLLDLLLPRRCVSCARLGEDLCSDCRTALPLLLGTHCERCGAPTAWPVRRCRECSGRRLAFASARAAVAYESSVPAVVAAWKERGLRRLAELAARRRRRRCLACPVADAKRSSRPTATEASAAATIRGASRPRPRATLERCR